MVFPKIIGVISVASFAKIRNRKQVKKKNLNFFESFDHKKGFKKKKISLVVDMFFIFLNRNLIMINKII
jgi:hypothetical protein